MSTNIFDQAIELAGSQQNLAKMAGLSQGAISKYKRGVAVPTGRSAEKLEKAVNGRISREQFVFVRQDLN